MGAACVATRNAQQIENLDSVAENPRIILMPPDIRYYLLTTGGLPQPHREWTETARDNFSIAARDFAESIGTDLRILDPDNIGVAESEYDRLHTAVGLTILNHHFGAARLPGKNNGQIFDWSLGPGISQLAEKHNADYALYVYYRDYQASGGRVAFSVLAAALGSYVPTGVEQGFASLVDLRSGDVVWFNVVGDGSGELRDASGAAAAVRTLFNGIPAAQQQGAIE